jgi:peptidoglycan biosynthesis protein MviN/MurJ (putative lipid II flippase)
MLLKAGAISLLLLVASRLLGLLRESAQAAAFGATGLADLAVLMLTLPDWITGVLASGALSYVLVPAWAGRSAAQVAASQRRVARVVLGLGLALGLVAVAALMLAPQAVLGWLAPGLPASLTGLAVPGVSTDSGAAGAGMATAGLSAMSPAASGLIWSALALAPALLAALWATRLQHEGDAVGLYGANLVVNGTLVAAIGFAGWMLGSSMASAPGYAGLGRADGAVLALGLGLLAAMGLRLAWQAWRERRARRSLAASEHAVPAAPRPTAPFSLPPPPVWAWAILAAGLPLALPFAARSLASAEGEGALAVFNYAWKLVELPLMLAIQLVATLAFPRVARAVAAGLDQPGTRAPVQAAFGLAFALACAACAGLLLAADVAARLLFGWGRMDPAGLAQVAEWSRIGAWSLLPQAVSAVGLTVLAAQARLRPAALWHALGLAVLLALGSLASSSAAFLMAALCAVLGMVALGVLAAMGGAVRRLLPWASMGAALAALAVVAWLAPWVTQLLPAPAWRLALAVLAALGVLAAAWAAAGPLRQTLRGRGA